MNVCSRNKQIKISIIIHEWVNIKRDECIKKQHSIKVQVYITYYNICLVSYPQTFCLMSAAPVRLLTFSGAVIGQVT
jgi:hypothetical protein